MSITLDINKYLSKKEYGCDDIYPSSGLNGPRKGSPPNTDKAIIEEFDKLIAETKVGHYLKELSISNCVLFQQNFCIIEFNSISDEFDQPSEAPCCSVPDSNADIKLNLFGNEYYDSNVAFTAHAASNESKPKRRSQHMYSRNDEIMGFSNLQSDFKLNTYIETPKECPEKTLQGMVNNVFSDESCVEIEGNEITNTETYVKKELAETEVSHELNNFFYIFTFNFLDFFLK